MIIFGLKSSTSSSTTGSSGSSTRRIWWIVGGSLAAVALVLVCAPFVATWLGFTALGSIRPADVSTTDNIDPLAKAAGLTLTDQTHDKGSFSSNASWSKSYTAPTGQPVCATVLNAATKLGYTVAPTLGITADNCAAKAGDITGTGTIVTTPSGRTSTSSGRSTRRP